LSGATALVYEVVWTRVLGLELGHTIAAASTVLAAFMGGLAAGAFYGGGIATRLSPRTALRAYAAIELGIGAFALLVPLLLRLAHPLLSATYADGGGLGFEAMRLACAAATVGAPAFLMGATYPLMVHATGVDADAGGPLYAANTIGATVGAVAAGFVLIRAFGTAGAALIGAAGNVLAAGIAWSLARSSAARPVDVSSNVQKPPRVRLAWGPTVVAAVAGFAALAIEVAWTRTLAMIMGPTTYAFSAMVACFIGGLAVGSTIGARVAARTAVPRAWMAVLCALASLSTALGMADVSDAVLDIGRRAADPGVNLATLVAHQVKWALWLIGPAAACFGAIFPVVLAAARATTAGAAANIYGANTLGAIAGSLGAGLVLLPHLGVRATFIVAIAVTSAAAILACVGRWRRAPLVATAVLAACAAAAFVVNAERWDPRLLSSGAYKYAAYLNTGGARDVLPALLRAGTLRYYREGATGTVAVRDVAGARSLSIDGKVDASNGRDMLTQRLLAHLPLLTHRDPQRVAVVGLGSGVTLGSALTYPVRSAEAIELSPEVVAASAWFTRENRNALSDGRVRLVQGDARTHFLLGRDRYDVIISEPSNPWMAGVAALFTREFFAALRARLAPGGIVCQWTHTYDISRADLQSIVFTFGEAFPELSMWLVGDGDLLLIGGERAGSVAASRVFASVPPPAAAADLAAAGIEAASELSIFYLGDAALAARWSAGARAQTDNRMALEFSAPSATVGASRHDNAGELVEASARQRSPESDSARIGTLLLAAQAPRRAWPHLQAAVQHAPDNANLVASFVKAAAAIGKLEEAGRTLEVLIRRHPQAGPLRLESAKILFARGETERARARVAEAAALAPHSPASVETLAGFAADEGDVEMLRAAMERLRHMRPRSARVAYFEGVLSLLGGDADRARTLAREALAADPSDAAAWNLLGAALGNSGGDPDEIGNAFRRAIAADPADAAGYVNLGTLYQRTGRTAEAADAFAQALTVDPASVAALAGLDETLRHDDPHPNF
jgi:spermidine synthase